MERQIYVEETMETVSLHLWDTAGQDEFETLTRRYYHGAVVSLDPLPCNLSCILSTFLCFALPV